MLPVGFGSETVFGLSLDTRLSATSNDEYLQTFNRPNVKLIDVSATQGVERLTENGFVADGQEYEIDCIMFASGTIARFTVSPQSARSSFLYLPFPSYISRLSSLQFPSIALLQLYTLPSQASPHSVHLSHPLPLSLSLTQSLSRPPAALFSFNRH